MKSQATFENLFAHAYSTCILAGACKSDSPCRKYQKICYLTSHPSIYLHFRNFRAHIPSAFADPEISRKIENTHEKEEVILREKIVAQRVVRETEIQSYDNGCVGDRRGNEKVLVYA